MIKKTEIKKVLFYTHSPRAFRTTLIGHLYEICQVYPAILLSEKLDSETEKTLKNKELFPKLEKIIPVQQFTGENRNLFSKNRYLFNLARGAVKEYKPDVVISASDVHSLFELYLFRFAKRINALKITIQPSNDIESATGEKWVDLINAYSRFPLFLPVGFRLFLANCRKYLGHFFYYWLLPLLIGEKPFFGKSSYILRKGNSGMRDADYQIVFSERDCRIYLEAGVPAEKLYILSHPLSRKTREFFNKAYFSKSEKQKKNKKVFSIMLTPTEFGFKRKDHSLILGADREKNWIETIKSINRIFPEWKIYIKPHPDIKNINRIRERFESISNNVEVINPREAADKYIETGDVIIGLPLSASTTLFTASLQCPEKPILSLDFHQEILGNLYKDFKGVEYVNTNRDLIRILEKIRDNKYHKTIPIQQGHKEEREFSGTVEMVDFLFNKREKGYKI